jgi:hypothetical protein
VAELAAQRLPPASEGLDTDASPEEVKPTKAPVVENFLVHRPGILPMRGPLNEVITYNAGAIGIKPIAFVPHADKILVGLRAASASAKRDPWEVMYRLGAEAAIGQASTTAYHVDLTTGTVTSVVTTRAQIPGPRYSRLGDYTWIIAYEFGASSGKVNADGAALQGGKLLRWTGAAVAPTVFTNVPGDFNYMDVKAHHQRLFVLGGYDSAETRNTLFFSDLDGPSSDVLTEWQDDVSGLTNQIVVESTNHNDFGVGLAKIGQNMAIFKRRSVHTLFGYSPSTFNLRSFASNIGCLDARSIIEWDEGCFFMSDQGFMYFDGAQLENVSKDVQSELLEHVLAAVGDEGVDGGRVSATRLPNGYLGLSVGVSDADSVEATTTYCAYYHPGRRAWAKLSSGLFLSSSRPTHFFRSNNYTLLADRTKIVKANALTVPELAAENERGFDNNSGTKYRIPAKWYSRLFKLSNPLHRSQLSRLLLDYKFQVDGAADDGNDGWFVKLVGGDGTTLLDEYQVPAQGDPTSYLYRRRHTKDVKSEASDVQLQVQWKDSGGTYPAVIKAELYDAVLEFQRTRQRRSG